MYIYVGKQQLHAAPAAVVVYLGLESHVCRIPVFNTELLRRLPEAYALKALAVFLYFKLHMFAAGQGHNAHNAGASYTEKRRRVSVPVWLQSFKSLNIFDCQKAWLYYLKINVIYRIFPFRLGIYIKFPYFVCKKIYFILFNRYSGGRFMAAVIFQILPGIFNGGEKLKPAEGTAGSASDSVFYAYDNSRPVVFLGKP